jgi:type I restriction enzyme R subunit
MRQALSNENADQVSKNHRYVMRITGDNEEGKAELDNFIDPENRYPTLVTTSRLLSTGVDVQTCKLIVLDRIIKSMTEFKQIIGRGTRINEDYNKYFFTIMDFKKATELFSDTQFDGEPVQIYEPKIDEPIIIDDPETGTETGDDGDGNGDDGQDDGNDGETIISDPEHPKAKKYYVDDVPVTVIAERVQYYGKDGKLITESLRDYTRNTVKKDFASLDDFLNRWKAAERKETIIQELEEAGVLFEPLAEAVGKDMGPFDLICHVVFGQSPLTRKERSDNVKKRNYFVKYGEKARAVLDSLLDKYADEGIENVESMNILKLPPINQHGTPIEIIESFGGKDQYMQAIKELEDQLYKVA